MCEFTCGTLTRDTKHKYTNPRTSSPPFTHLHGHKHTAALTNPLLQKEILHTTLSWLKLIKIQAPLSAPQRNHSPRTSLPRPL